jgi:bifunctional enzyme CysN/CysC
MSEADSTPHSTPQPEAEIHLQSLLVNQAQRAALMGQKPCVIWITGLSGAGKSTLANLLEARLIADGRHTYLIDGDNLRYRLNRDLGFSDRDRAENIRRAAEVARLMVDAGLIVLVALISPLQVDRQLAREVLGYDDFIEVFVNVPLEVAEARDPKGLYKKARSGEIKHFTGIDSPYEAPLHPDLVVDAHHELPDVGVRAVLDLLLQRGLLDAR